MTVTFVWSILSLWLVVSDQVILTGEFPTQAKCLDAMKHKTTSRELPPDVYQCVRLEKSVLHLYAQEDKINQAILEKIRKERMEVKK